MSGWVKLYRKTLHSDMYKNLTLAQRDVMMCCLMLANHKEKQWEWRGEVQKCKPGQFKTSLPSLAKKCAPEVTPKMVRTALDKLEKWGFVACERSHRGQVVTVCNWEAYQGGENVNGHTDGQTQGTVRAHSGHTGGHILRSKEYKEDQEVREEELSPSPILNFEKSGLRCETFWVEARRKSGLRTSFILSAVDKDVLRELGRISGGDEQEIKWAMEKYLSLDDSKLKRYAYPLPWLVDRWNQLGAEHQEVSKWSK